MRLLAPVLFLLAAAPLPAHIGSPDIFFEGKAGPYVAVVTIRPPVVIPGVAEVEIRFPNDDIREVRIVPLPLTGAGSDRPPASDLAIRSKEDSHFFTGSVWLMAFGSYQVRFDVAGIQGTARLSVPVPAIALQVKKMDRRMGLLLSALMLFLLAGIVTVVGAAVKEAQLAPGLTAAPSLKRKSQLAMAITALAVTLILLLGFRWWNSDESMYLGHVYKPLTMAPTLSGTKLSLTLSDPGWLRFRKTDDFIPDHGHLMHLFVVRMPGLDRMWHLHPDLEPNNNFLLDLPSIQAGHYKLFGDVVHENGFPETLAAEIDLPEIAGRPLSGDDADGTALPVSQGEITISPLRGGYRMIWVRDKQPLKPRQLSRFSFRIEDAEGKPATDMELYMGMPGHAEFMTSDGSVFAHVHPDGSVPMASLMLTHVPMQHATGQIPAEISFPYGIPKPGHYRIFVQVQRTGHPETGVFDVNVM